MTRKWVQSLGIIAGGILTCAIVFAGYVGYRIYYHGLPALDRIVVGAPTATIRYGTSPLQLVDLRVPQGRGPFPVAVLLHGGCWDNQFGKRATMAPLADALRQRGVASLVVGYRRVGDAGGGWPGTMRDVGQAVDAVATLARRYPIDANAVVVVGHSAGAHLALWTAMRDRLAPASDLFVPAPLRPRAIVAIDGPGALAEFIGLDAEVCDKPVIVPFMGGTPAQVPARYRDATPQDHLPLRTPQYLVQAAFADRMQPYIDRARRAGDRVVAIRPERATHFDILNPNQRPGAETLALTMRSIDDMRGAGTPR